MLSPKLFAARQDLTAGRPTAQSSIDQSDVSVDRQGVQVEVVGRAMVPTNTEMNPWWQVDLLNVYRIEEIALFNSRQAPNRLHFFSVLFSLDNEEWVRVFAKKNKEDFGGDGRPLRIKFPSILHARFVRLRLDGYDQLEFNRLAVFGSPVNAPVLSVGAVPPPDPRREIVKIDGMEIFLDRENYSEILTDALEAGRYEHRERAMLKFALAPGDRVLEIGTALGVVTMLAARIVGAENIVTFDGNPQMIEHARRNFAHNGLPDIRAENAILKNSHKWKGQDEKVDFYISRNFWASGLTRNFSTVSVASVPAFCLESVVVEHKSNVLICDIEGGEIELLMDADLSRIDTIMMEVHYSRGEGAINRLIRRLVNSGFSIDLRATGSCVVLMYRGFRLKRAVRDRAAPARSTNFERPSVA